MDLANISDLDKVSIVGLSKIIQNEYEVNSISALATKLEVPLMTENRNRKALLDKLSSENKSEQKKQFQVSYEPSIATKEIITFLLKNSGAVKNNDQRNTYAPWLKCFFGKMHEGGTSFNDIALLTGISIDTLENFKDFNLENKSEMTEKHILLAEIWKQAPSRSKKNLEGFWTYLGKKHDNLSVSYKEVRQLLIDLGFYSPRGPKIVDKGAQVKKKFEPHTIWEGDGKNIKIAINELEYNFLWYAFVDQTTTLIVGSSMNKVESSEAFLQALKDGKNNASLYPIGVLIDNRIEGSDLNPARQFCDEHGITLVKTFPGNSKSNGNIENNFSIFERFIGEIKIQGTDARSISQSIVQNLVEVFTELRNNKPRKRLENKTPADVAKDAERPINNKTAVENLAKRFESNALSIDEKWQLLQATLIIFGVLDMASIEKFKSIIKYYAASDLVSAQASFLAQVAKHSDQTYGPEYFLAILRNKRESNIKRTYNESFIAGTRFVLDCLQNSAVKLNQAEIIVEEFEAIINDKSPSHQYLHLDALCTAIINHNIPSSLPTLWQEVQKKVERSAVLGLRLWQQINEYVMGKIGRLLIVPQ